MIDLKNGSTLTIEGHRYAASTNLYHYDLWVACAIEYNPYDVVDIWPMTLWCPIDDIEPPPAPHMQAAIRASKVAADDLEAGANILVTCAMGLNRSALVAGLALRRLGWGPNKVVDTIRQDRGPLALGNMDFRLAVIRGIGKDGRSLGGLARQSMFGEIEE
jgi:hypothetical protein